MRIDDMAVESGRGEVHISMSLLPVAFGKPVLFWERERGKKGGEKRK